MAFLISLLIQVIELLQSVLQDRLRSLIECATVLRRDCLNMPNDIRFQGLVVSGVLRLQFLTPTQYAKKKFSGSCSWKKILATISV